MADGNKSRTCRAGVVDDVDNEDAERQLDGVCVQSAERLSKLVTDRFGDDERLSNRLRRFGAT